MEEEKRIADKVIKAIEYSLKGSFGEYFSYAWRDKIGELIKSESKYVKLLEWLVKEIEQKLLVINVFCPADKSKHYSNGDFQLYTDQMKDLAIMIHCRELLLDERTTEEMRENIEYTICKVYGIHYSEELKEYV